MSPKPISDNTLFYGDNLKILREYIPDESVDLIYLDPPFNSSRSYNVLFKDESGSEAESQIMAFDDTWHWGESAAQQNLTIEELRKGKVVNMPPTAQTFKQAPKADKAADIVPVSYTHLTLPTSDLV